MPLILIKLRRRNNSAVITTCKRSASLFPRFKKKLHNFIVCALNTLQAAGLVRATLLVDICTNICGSDGFTQRQKQSLGAVSGMHEPDLGRDEIFHLPAAGGVCFVIFKRPAFHFHLTLNPQLDLAKKSEQQAHLLLYSQPWVSILILICFPLTQF